MHSGNAHGGGSGDGSSNGRSRRCIRRPPRTCARANGDQRGRVHEAVRGTSARSYRRMGSLKRADVHSRRLCTLECCSTSSACRSASPFAPVHATPWARRESMIFCVALAEGGWCTWTLHASREAGCRARLRWSARQPGRSITYQACRYSARTRGPAARVDVCQLETQGDVRRPAAQTIASATSLSAAPERAHGNRLTWSRVLCVSGLL